MTSAFPTAWRTLIGHRNPRFMVKGHELAVTLYGPANRFAVYEVRTLTSDGPSCAYRVRDAETVSDAEVRAGIGSRVIGDGLLWQEVEALVARLCPPDATCHEEAA
jgi:hypothetical protein